MVSVTIPGNKATPAKTFTVGDAYHGNTSYGWSGKDMVFNVISIDSARVYWEDVFRGTTGSFTTKQFSILSKNTTALNPENKKKLVGYLFEVFGSFPFG